MRNSKQILDLGVSMREEIYERTNKKLAEVSKQLQDEKKERQRQSNVFLGQLESSSDRLEERLSLEVNSLKSRNEENMAELGVELKKFEHRTVDLAARVEREAEMSIGRLSDMKYELYRSIENLSHSVSERTEHSDKALLSLKNNLDKIHGSIAELIRTEIETRFSSDQLSY